MPYPNVNTLDDLNQAIDQYARSPKQPPLKGEELNYILKKMIQLAGTGIPESFAAEVEQGAIAVGDQVQIGTLPAVSETIRLMLKTSIPTLTDPTFTFTQSAGTLRRVGEVLDVTLAHAFDRGRIEESWSRKLQNFRTGIATGVLIQGTAAQMDSDFTISNYTVKAGYNEFQASVSFAAGPQPKDRKGDNYQTPYPAGTLQRSTGFEGVYPVYATTLTIQNLTAQPLTTQMHGWVYDIDLAAESSGYKQSFWLPDYLVQIGHPLYSLQIYNVVSDLFEDTDKLGNFGVTPLALSGVAGKKYTYYGPDRGKLKIKIRSEVTGPASGKIWNDNNSWDDTQLWND